ncbi:PilZ domain-containing protein [Psychromonas sp. psych-6C06]|uniref:PilZ domain-containing protein n=1 Tax=Psychromonas sp. psych-6C06 TaxID=2058089 RepID=UPI000C33B0DD|nr:PilZ domain-containing protein [Psychromonas sp. psych-6C06]PKF61093.1 PilZ domain-containing protein [Psychromonas sp. psych-6C06]
MTNNQYFLVEHQLSLNVEGLAENECIPNDADFEAEIPAPFRMASDLAQIESHSLQPLKLNNETTQALWSYLQTQNLKINTLLTYVLSQQDDQRLHFQSDAFSASVCVFKCGDARFAVDQPVRLKIFIPEESAAIYCYALVTKVEQGLIELTYQQIREEDRELLIRTTLHIQSKQLKLRAQQRASL